MNESLSCSRPRKQCADPRMKETVEFKRILRGATERILLQDKEKRGG